MHWFRGAWLLCLVFLSTAGLLAQSHPMAQGEEVVARVDGEPITVREVDREIRIAFPNRQIADEAQTLVRQKAVEQVIKRRLILKWLEETGRSASADDIRRAMTQLRERLQKLGSTLDEFLKQQDLDEAGLERSLAWQIGWQRYLDQQLVDSNLEKYFLKHRIEFDGSEVRVAHILFKPDQKAGEKGWEAARARAKECLAQIRSKNLTFAEAAKRYSDSPSREQGGDIGFISRHQPMPEPFSAAAFRLETLQVSEPIETVFGVHLILRLDLKPGDKGWQDVRPRLEDAITQYLFDWAAEQGKRVAKVDFPVR